MVIHRILNNNVVIILDENQEESVICGKGIAFKKKNGDEIDEKLINKVFVLKNKEMNRRFQQLLKDIPLQYVDLADEIVNMAETKLNKKMNDSLIISLSDHIYTAINRLQDGLTIRNAMIWDIKRYYKDEFEIGIQILEVIKQKFNVELPEDEAAFIAVHIANASMEEDDVKQVVDIIHVMQEVSNIVKYYFSIEFDTESVYYYRFMTHLKFFAQRLIKKSTYCDESNNELLKMVSSKYNDSAKCVEKVSLYLLHKYHYSLSDEERLYLMIHIERVVHKGVNEI